MDEKKRIEELVAKLKEASDAYYNSRDEIMTNFPAGTLDASASISLFDL